LCRRIKYLRRFNARREEREMNLREKESARRFAKYVGGLACAVGTRVRTLRLKEYCTGLLLPGERKSVEPIAAKIAPAQTAAEHQRLLHFVNEADWSDEKVVAKVREMVLPAIERPEPILAWIIDDTSFPKKGRHSVGVARQYCGQLGKQENCQVAVSLSIANHHASLPVAYRLYLPKTWAEDEARRKKAGVPDHIRFQTKTEIALDQLRWACEAGLPRGDVLVDPDYGTDARFRTSVAALGLSYVAGIQSTILVWPPGTGPRRRGRPLNNTGRRDEPDLVSVKELALSLPKKSWRIVKWREGSADWLSSRFARVRVRAAHTYLPPEQMYEEWLLIEWPEGEAEPSKYWLSTLPMELPLEVLVDYAKLRWRIERDYLELKQEIGLGHYEGRGWLGFHHHATLCIAAYGFLISERETIPPSGAASATLFKALVLPTRRQSRGSARAA
jgi:SRSO17 transposase